MTKPPRLKDLLKGMTLENRHPLVDIGPDVGREIIGGCESWQERQNYCRERFAPYTFALALRRDEK